MADDMEVVMGANANAIPPNFYREIINHSDWTIPERYTELQTVGHGAYGSVCSARDTSIGWVRYTPNVIRLRIIFDECFRV